MTTLGKRRRMKMIYSKENPQSLEKLSTLLILHRMRISNKLKSSEFITHIHVQLHLFIMHRALFNMQTTKQLKFQVGRIQMAPSLNVLALLYILVVCFIRSLKTKVIKQHNCAT